MIQDDKYDLKSIQMPRLTGGALRLFDELVENSLTQGLLMGKLLRDGGIEQFRQRVIAETPTFLPLHPGTSPAPGGYQDPPRWEDLPPKKPSTRGFAFKTVRDYAEAYLSGATTPEAVAECVLEAITASDAADPPMRIFIVSDPEDVMAQARASTQRYRRGEPLSIFDGVPVAVKDEVDMRPYPTTVGTRFLGRTPAAEDATVVARMRAAGALLLGKANMYEIGINPFGFNMHHGTVRNPYNVSHNTGGSSSGPAAAVAAGLCPVAIGADGGGSIRIPASFCGIVGLKPTFGRVSEHGAYPLCWSVAHLGPLAASAEDAALAYLTLAGPDPQDANSLLQPPVNRDGWMDGGLESITLGVYWPWFRHAAPAVVSTCETLLNELGARGARLKELQIPDLEACRVAHAITILSEMAASLDAEYKEHRRDLAPAVRASLVIGRVLTASDYVQAQRVRTRLITHFQDALKQVDAIVTPATAISAPFMQPAALAGDESDLSVVTEIMRFVFPPNLTGHPAISFPAGYDQAGLPVGLQAIGRPWEEHVLFRLASAAQQIVKLRKPQVYYEILK